MNKSWINNNRETIFQIINIIKSLKLSLDVKILDVGCGDGTLLYKLDQEGYRESYGFDIWEPNLNIAKENFSTIYNKLFIHNLYEPELLPNFPKKYKLITSQEVIEHLFSPSIYLRNIHSWLEDNGYLIITTPYHGYIKNLFIAILNKSDFHFDPLGEGGHIKFYSQKSLVKVLAQNGFKVIKFNYCRRIPYLWRLMVVLAQKE